MSTYSPGAEIFQCKPKLRLGYFHSSLNSLRLTVLIFLRTYLRGASLSSIERLRGDGLCSLSITFSVSSSSATDLWLNTPTLSLLSSSKDGRLIFSSFDETKTETLVGVRKCSFSSHMWCTRTVRSTGLFCSSASYFPSKEGWTVLHSTNLDGNPLE